MFGRREAQKEKELIEKKLARVEASRSLDVTALQVCCPCRDKSTVLVRTLWWYIHNTPHNNPVNQSVV